MLPHTFNIENLKPRIDAVFPKEVEPMTRVQVTVQGANFMPLVTSASLGLGITVDSATIISAGQLVLSISVRADAAIGTRTLTVFNSPPGGGIDSLVDCLVVAAPIVSAVSGQGNIVPREYTVSHPYPNPFNPVSRIRYGVPEQSRIQIEVCNILGNKVDELCNGVRSAGVYEAAWVAGDLPTGVYFIRIRAVSLESAKVFTASRKTLYVK